MRQVLVVGLVGLVVYLGYSERLTDGQLCFIALVTCLVFYGKRSLEVSELRDLVLWYRRALADHRISWEDVEQSRLVHYEMEPELRPGGAYRGGQSTGDMKFVRPEGAREFIARFNRWWRRIKSYRRN